LELIQRLRSAWRVVRSPATGVPSPAARTGAESAARRGAALTRKAFRVAFLVGVLAILGYAARGDWVAFLRIASLGLLLGGAGLCAGALLGFIFGVPRTEERPSQAEGTRTGADAAPPSARQAEYRGNTNLEQISDWLTKILVGVSLTQYRQIVASFRSLVGFLSRALVLGSDKESAQAFVFGLLVFSAVCGFFLGYILTRIYFAVALRSADLSLAEFRPSIDLQVTQLLFS
jgi:hypothetical protein